MTARLNKRQREQRRRQREAEADRDAGMLPHVGPIAELVSRIGVELDRCIVGGVEASEAAATLHPLGVAAFQAVGSIRGMRAIGQVASTTGQGQPRDRHNLLRHAWAGIGDDRGVWAKAVGAHHVATR